MFFLLKLLPGKIPVFLTWENNESTWTINKGQIVNVAFAPTTILEYISKTWSNKLHIARLSHRQLILMQLIDSIRFPTKPLEMDNGWAPIKYFQCCDDLLANVVPLASHNALVCASMIVSASAWGWWIPFRPIDIMPLHNHEALVTSTLETRQKKGKCILFKIL